jgi:hypothetical protein
MKTPAEKTQTAEMQVGMSVLVAASFYVDAMRQCRIVGIGNLHSFANNKGALLQEISAHALAGLAEQQVSRYFAECKAQFTDSYCFQLAARAEAIEWRRPVVADGER